MRTPSRKMPKRDEGRSLGWLGWSILSLIIGIGSAFWIVADKWQFLFVVGFLILFAFVLIARARLEDRRLVRQRPCESICTFSRSFKRGEIDTWVIRAVYEEIASYFPTTLQPAPIRRDDDLLLWGLDAEEVEDLGKWVSTRCSRSLKDTTTNPFYGRVRTVGDLVQFLNAQPKQIRR